MTTTLPTSTQQRPDGATLAGLYIVVLMVVPARLVLSGVPLSISPATAIALVLATCWFCAQLTANLGMAKGRSLVRTALFLSVSSMLASYGYAAYGYLPDDELRVSDTALVYGFALTAVALLVIDGIRSRERLDLLLKIVVIASAFVAIVGIMQFTVGFDLTDYMKGPFLRYTEEYSSITDRDSFRRAASTTSNAIEFGVMMAMVLPLALHFAWRAHDRKEPRRYGWWTAAALIGLGLAFSVSRSATLGLGAVLIVLMLGWPKRRKLPALGGLMAAVAVLKVISPGLIGAIYGLFANLSDDSSIQYRQQRYGAVVDEFIRSPLFGHGIGTWWVPKHFALDNQYLLTLIESGTAGVIALVLFFGTGLWATLRVWRLGVDEDARLLGISLFASLLVAVIGSATFDLTSFPTVAGLTYLLIGACGAAIRIHRLELRSMGPRGVLVSDSELGR